LLVVRGAVPPLATGTTVKLRNRPCLSATATLTCCYFPVELYEQAIDSCGVTKSAEDTSDDVEVDHSKAYFVLKHIEANRPYYTRQLDMDLETLESTISPLLSAQNMLNSVEANEVDEVFLERIFSCGERLARKCGSAPVETYLQRLKRQWDENRDYEGRLKELSRSSLTSSRGDASREETGLTSAKDIEAPLDWTLVGQSAEGKPHFPLSNDQERAPITREGSGYPDTHSKTSEQECRRAKHSVDATYGQTNCVHVQNDDNCCEAGHSGLLSELQAALEVHVGKAEVVESTCRALTGLCNGNRNIAKEAKNIGLLHDIQAVLQQHMDSPKVVHAACEAVSSICAGDGVKPQVPDKADHASGSCIRELRMSEILSDWEEFSLSFNEMDLHEDLLRGIYACGYKEPTGIQQKGIVPLTKGLNVIQIATSSSERIVTLSIGILNNLNYSNMDCQAIILVPTGDHALDVSDTMGLLGEFLEVRCHACIKDDIRDLPAGVQAISGTPMRIYEMLIQRVLRPESIEIVVLHEADQLFSWGLESHVNGIFQLLPTQLQICMSAATLPPEALQFSQKYMDHPVRILAQEIEMLKSISRGISATKKHFYYDVYADEWKVNGLCDLYETLDSNRSVVFVKSHVKVDELAEVMQDRNRSVLACHECMESNAQEDSTCKFASDASRVIITTDQQAHAIDFSQVSIIVNYDLPSQLDDYASRVAKFDESNCYKQVVISFATRGDERMLRDIEKSCDISMEELQLDHSTCLKY